MGKDKSPRELPDAVEVLVVGAGPHALALASRLLLGPDAMQDVIAPDHGYVRKPAEVRAHLRAARRLEPRELAVVDGGGAWLRRWEDQFQALGIKYLRSHEMMHPDAFDFSSLSEWARCRKRTDFLHLERMTKDSTYHGPFTLPSNRMMIDFCKHLVKCGGLEGNLFPGHVEALHRRAAAEGGVEVTVRSAGAGAGAGRRRVVVAKHVVIARGPTWRRNWPAFYHSLETAAMVAIRHAWDLFSNPDEIKSLKGTGVVVGGGLTSAHLCAQLAPRGCVHLLVRRDLRVKQYDLELSWMGMGRWRNRHAFEKAPVEERLAINKAARDGGSITPELRREMRKLEEQERLTVHEFTEVVAASYEGCWTIVLENGEDGEVLTADYLICASGTSVDISTDPLLADLQRSHPLRLVGGLPMLTENLQWGDVPVYLMGNLAALELGPDAVNMNGATRGSFRICSALAREGFKAPSNKAKRPQAGRARPKPRLVSSDTSTEVGESEVEDEQEK